MSEPKAYVFIDFLVSVGNGSALFYMVLLMVNNSNNDRYVLLKQKLTLVVSIIFTDRPLADSK